ncbi:ATP-dependent DNA helicase RecG [Aestuariimicrobium ganziense]|uniref:ATP-dependent DNA helicase RecG n=1 Tax=Aestuariimicrobium ganziense TaxID=2773677 RepID=UPI001945A05A|nr:ATP-dependent DNA helicase RecG [Aestuariimicrobium ganziense]
MVRWQTDTFARLNAPLSSVLGDKTAKAMAKLRLRTTGDLMRHLPRRYLRGTEESSDLSRLQDGEDVALLARVRNVKKVTSQRARVEAVLTDGRNEVDVTFFAPKHWMPDFFEKQLTKGVQGIFVGRVGTFRDRFQLTHPNFVMIDRHGTVVGSAERVTLASAVSRSGLVGLYPSSSALPTWTISASAEIVREHLSGLDEPLPDWVREQRGLPTLEEAFAFVHAGETLDQTERGAERLRFDEALALQLTMAYRRLDQSHHLAAPMPGAVGGLLDAFDDTLPFTLTRGQRQVGAEIDAELSRDKPMQRLLQGEVGSGKTLVALRAMLRVVDSGHQAVLLAPTEVLAAQHADTLRRLLGDLAAGQVLGAPEQATEVVLLSGSLPAAVRRDTLAKAANGQAGIIVGTHALLSDAVEFASLGLVVVDEQHRFGVEQRARLNEAGRLRPHVLVMTATPIPRSVAMTVFGDLETSTLTEIPAGRADVQTTVVDVEAHPGWLDRAWQRIREEVGQGRQAFVVAPAISSTVMDDTADAVLFVDGAESTSTRPLTSVEDLHDDLRNGVLAGLRIGMLHGRMPTDEKDKVMSSFASGDLDVLVSTTVVEVGVDVPNASVMVVMDADRFGISQLHQLRGRIGRGSHPGLCLLITGAEEGSPARERLAAVASTRDGFVLAEADLNARREGDVLGASQAGTRSTLRLLRVLEHADTIIDAREVAERLVADDPRRENPFLADLVTQTELLAAGDWLERT